MSAGSREGRRSLATLANDIHRPKLPAHSTVIHRKSDWQIDAANPVLVDVIAALDDQTEVPELTLVTTVPSARLASPGEAFVVWTPVQPSVPELQSRTSRSSISRLQRCFGAAAGPVACEFGVHRAGALNLKY